MIKIEQIFFKMFFRVSLQQKTYFLSKSATLKAPVSLLHGF